MLVDLGVLVLFYFTGAAASRIYILIATIAIVRTYIVSCVVLCVRAFFYIIYFLFGTLTYVIVIRIHLVRNFQKPCPIYLYCCFTVSDENFYVVISLVRNFQKPSLIYFSFTILARRTNGGIMFAFLCLKWKIRDISVLC